MSCRGLTTVSNTLVTPRLDRGVQLKILNYFVFLDTVVKPQYDIECVFFDPRKNDVYY
nr:palindromic element RPE4 domain-containing protein [Rickettsia australis]